MSNTYSPRRILVVLAALLLPAATCGVAPALRDLMKRTERLERFVENAQLPPVLVDDRGNVIGRVLEYNDVMLYTSVVQIPDNLGLQTRLPFHDNRNEALISILYEVPGQAPVVLEANRAELLVPVIGWKEVYFFESPDCSGDFWTSNEIASWFGDQSVVGNARIAPPGRTLYTADLDSPGQLITPRSALYGREGSERSSIPAGQNPCFSVDEIGLFVRVPRTATYIPFRPVYDLDAYTPPFKIADQRDLLLQ